MASITTEKLLTASTLPSSLVVYSADRIRKEGVLFELIETHALTPSRIQGNSLNAAKVRELADELQSLSLFAGTSCVILDDAHLVPAKLVPSLLEVVSAVGAGSSLVMLMSAKPRSKKWWDGLKKASLVLEFPELNFDKKDKRKALNDWVKETCYAVGLTSFPLSITELLWEGSEGDVDTMYQMINQLSLFCETDTATLEDVHSLFTLSSSPHVFDLSNAVLDRNLKKVEHLIASMTIGKDSCFQIVGLMARSISKLLVLKDLERRRVPLKAIKAQTKLFSEPLLARYRKSASTHSFSDLRAMLIALLKVDARFKNKSIADEALLRMVLTEIMK